MLMEAVRRFEGTKLHANSVESHLKARLVASTAWKPGSENFKITSGTIISVEYIQIRTHIIPESLTP